MTFRRKQIPPPPLPHLPAPNGGALVAFADAAGTILAYGSYLGTWELNGGFRNRSQVTLVGVAAGAAVSGVTVDVATRSVVGVGPVEPVDVAIGGSVIIAPGDLVIHVEPDDRDAGLFDAVLALPAP